MTEQTKFTKGQEVALIAADGRYHTATIDKVNPKSIVVGGRTMDKCSGEDAYREADTWGRSTTIVALDDPRAVWARAQETANNALLAEDIRTRRARGSEKFHTAESLTALIDALTSARDDIAANPRP